LPDDLCFNNHESVLHQMYQIHKKYPDKNIIAVEEVRESEVDKYGIIMCEQEIDDNLFLVGQMIEKPSIKEAPSNLAIIGRYILNYEVFNYLEKVLPDSNGEIQVTNALKEMAKEGKVLAYKFKGRRLDCGSVEGYINANIFFQALNNK